MVTAILFMSPFTIRPKLLEGQSLSTTRVWPKGYIYWHKNKISIYILRHSLDKCPISWMSIQTEKTEQTMVLGLFSYSHNGHTAPYSRRVTYRGRNSDKKQDNYICLKTT